jgi:hypothetical protein
MPDLDPAAQPAYTPCAYCAEPVVIAALADGTAVVLDAHAPTYALLWNPGAVQAVVVPTHAFAVHACGRLCSRCNAQETRP